MVRPFHLIILMGLLLFRNNRRGNPCGCPDDNQYCCPDGPYYLGNHKGCPYHIASFFIFVFSILNVSAQEINLGIPLLQEQLPENYSYNPLFITARFPILSQAEKRLQFYVEPQLAVTSPPEGIAPAFEFGSNLGIQYTLWEGPKQAIKAPLGVGPHYTSVETALQHKGFLFSDNIEIGYYQTISANWGFQIKGRFRHLSNANLLKPNKGLDNGFLMMGVFWR